MAIGKMAMECEGTLEGPGLGFWKSSTLGNGQETQV